MFIQSGKMTLRLYPINSSRKHWCSLERIMCILFIFTDPSPKEGGYRAIIASNRDEFYKRPAKAAYTCEQTGIIGGKDLNGTSDSMWLGMSLKQSSDYKFRFGALLNVSGESKKPNGKARGVIVSRYLSSSSKASVYSDELHETADTFNAFNFVSVELSDATSSITYNSNAPLEKKKYEGFQFLAFGNSPEKTPLQKVKGGQRIFQITVNKYNNTQEKTGLVNELLQLLKCEKRFLPDDELIRRLPCEECESVSAIYVKFVEAGYGTRTHSIILIDYDWNVEFIEASMVEPIDPHNPSWHTVHIKSQL